ncbi:response regulator transcription factor [Paenibacillus arenilitoris]|uniref:Response regulator n=1 Tax=Paenibacillus arenilitoris TaxID=2772299 RepID=A0A927H4M7_9BACL|nr:response regulator [Paenibacillus arenilitoris]MBD2868576.1 response regulator [Paenibacillus arenilitoris]
MLKLLIVDDEPIILAGLEHLIRGERSAFTDIERASDAFEALDLLDTFRPDLIITDIQMPAMDGLAFIHEAQQKGAKRFVILSGYDHFDYARQALRLQVNDYLLKPIQKKELSEILNRLTLEIMEERKEMPKPADAPSSPEQETSVPIRKFQAYVRTHFMRDIALDEVAEHLNLHPNYFCTVLKKETGMTFLQYLHTVRIENAKELLANPDPLTMEQIAKSVGFESPRHFYKVFKQFTGQTPGAYKQLVIGETTPEP